MKVPQSLRGVYDNLLERYSLLMVRVNSYISENKNTRWHYEGRIKDIESFAQKIECGRYSSPDAIDDFFACTLVVEHFGNVRSAVDFIGAKFRISYRRPRDDDYTHKHSYSFQFDDLRLYVYWQDNEGSPPSGLDGLLFEVQIKTFLQHAWAIATHDMVYKSPTVDWSKQRISYQIKALLEHAEVAIAESSALSQCKILQKEDRDTRRSNELLKIITEIWEPDKLPADIKTLSQNIGNIMKAVGVSPESLKSYLISETGLGRGAKTLNLSPYGVVVQTLFFNHYNGMERYLLDDNKDFKVLIAHEVDTLQLNRDACHNAIFLPRAFL